MQRMMSATLLLLAAACSNAGGDLGLPPLTTGQVKISVFLDRDGTGNLSAFDTTYGGAAIALFMREGIDTFVIKNTAGDGEATFTGLPIGRYRYALVPASLGDTLSLGSAGSGRFQIRADSLAGLGSILVSYPTLTIAEARQAAPGRPVFVRGVVASPLQFFGDSATFLVSGNDYLRVTSAEHRPGRNGNNIGDSVVVFGRTGTDLDQPVLQDGVVLTLDVRPPPAPVDVRSGEAATARSGDLDAALVQLDHAAIGDTATVAGVFTVWAIDTAATTDSVRVAFDPQLQVNRTGFAIGRGIVTRGVLVPDGAGRWILKPRPVNGEVVLN